MGCEKTMNIVTLRKTQGIFFLVRAFVFFGALFVFSAKSWVTGLVNQGISADAYCS